jgi:hypothetical protein
MKHPCYEGQHRTGDLNEGSLDCYRMDHMCVTTCLINHILL